MASPTRVLQQNISRKSEKNDHAIVVPERNINLLGLNLNYTIML